MKMKRNRLISLLLVLAMMLALAPAVFAAEAAKVELNKTTTTIAVGDTDALTATLKDEKGDPVDGTVTWTSSDDTVATVSSNGLITGLKVGTATITAQVGSGEGAPKAECTVTVEQATVTVSTTLAAQNMPKGASNDQVQQKLDSVLNSALGNNAAKLTLSAKWMTDSFDSTKVDTARTFTKQLTLSDPDNYKFADNAESVTVTCEVTFRDAPAVTFKSKSYSAGGIQNTKVLNVAKDEANDSKKALQVSLEWTPDDASLTYQWFKGTTAVYSDSTYSAITSETALNYPSGASVGYTPSVSAAGTTYYVCKIVASKNDMETTSISDVFTVNVQSPLRVQLTRTYGTSTVGTRASFTATVQKFNTTKNTYETATYGTDYTSVAFAIVDSKLAALGSYSTTTSATSTVYVDLKAAGTTTLTATLYNSSSTVGTGSADITISAATAQTITQNPTSASYALLDETQLVNAVYTATRNASTNPVSYATPTKFVFQAINGSFSLNGSSSYSSTYTAYTYTTPRVGSVYFVPNTSYGFTSANVYVTYTAYDTNGNAVATGTVKFTGASSISYSASANTAVSFSATDFQTFFKQSMNNSSYATLSYVTFGTPYVSSGSATVGTLYYNNSYIYTNTQVPAASLGYVSYLPSNSLTSYTVSIPFTAYGYNGSYSYGTPTSTASGIVTIKVNDGHVIGMTGTSFQSAGVSTEIYTAYPSASYVRFTLPQSTVGKLYYGYSSIASKGTAVSYTDYFYNTNVYSSTQKSVNNVYFLPAAGCANSVSIGYTVYSSANVALGSGTVTFTVNKKTSSGYFSDVTASNTGNWSADAIDFLASNSIITGKDSYTFAPKANMTRGDFVLMLYRLAGKPSVSGVSNPFTDVKTTDYYYSAILWAYRNNVVTGVDAKTFAPKKNITREQIAATLYRLAGKPTATSSVTGYYDSSKIHSYALSAVKWAVGNGVLGGSGGYLNPTNNATRAEVAAMLHRYLTK